MKNYVMLDNASGYVWGSARGAYPEAACRALDAQHNEARFTYEAAARPSGSNESGYFVYDATGFDLNDTMHTMGADGGSERLIARVAALPLVGYFRGVERDDA